MINLNITAHDDCREYEFSRNVRFADSASISFVNIRGKIETSITVVHHCPVTGTSEEFYTFPTELFDQMVRHYNANKLNLKEIK